nr:hypothetical protein [Actinomycetales bacterium]
MTTRPARALIGYRTLIQPGAAAAEDAEDAAEAADAACAEVGASAAGGVAAAAGDALTRDVAPTVTAKSIDKVTGVLRMAFSFTHSGNDYINHPVAEGDR